MDVAGGNKRDSEGAIVAACSSSASPTGETTVPVDGTAAAAAAAAAEGNKRRKIDATVAGRTSPAEDDGGKADLDERDGTNSGSSPQPATSDTPPAAGTSAANNSDDAKLTKKKKRSKRTKTKNIDPAVLALRRTVQSCCATDDLSTAIHAYDAAVSDDVRVEAQTFYNLLNLCDGLGDRGVHVGTPRVPRGAKQQARGAQPARPTTNGSATNGGEEGEGERSGEEAKDAEVGKEEAAADTSTTYGGGNAPVIRNVEPRERMSHAFRIKKHMEKLDLPLNETAYTALIRILSKARDWASAESVLTEAERCPQCRPRLRMYSSLLIAYAEAGDLRGCVRTWERMENISGGGGGGSGGVKEKVVEGKGGGGGTAEVIRPSEREYCAMIRCCAKAAGGNNGNGNGNTNTDAIADANAAGIVMDRVLSDLAEDVLVPGGETTDAIVSWFESPIAVAGSEEPTGAGAESGGGGGDGNGNGNGKEASELESEKMETIASHLPPGDAPSLGPAVCPHGSSWTVSRNCTVDTATGTITSGCLRGKKLLPVLLSAEAWGDLMKMNETIVLRGHLEGDSSRYQGGGKGPKRKLDRDRDADAVDRRRRNWEAFKRYLEKRVGPPSGVSSTVAASADGDGDITSSMPRSSPQSKSKYDVVIDGANVGYYKQNFANAPKHVDYQQIDWAVLHFLERGKSVLLVLHERHFHPKLMPPWAEPIVRSWEQKGVLFRAPAGSNDDWFWLHAALWCGRDTLVLTNDEMRDHHFQMLAHRHFLRWKERNQVHFAFGDWHSVAGGGGGSSKRRRRLEPSYPDIYSRRMQRLDDESLAIPLAKRGDTNRFLDGAHDAGDTAPVEEMYVCIKMNRAGDDRS